MDMPFLLMIFAWSAWTGASEPKEHAFHVSRCEIRHNTARQSLEVTMHIFIDDLEVALKKQGHDKLFLCTEREAPRAEEYLAQYLRQQFQLSVNGKMMSYAFLGKETSDDMIAAWCYLEVKGVKSVQSVWVRDSILLEIFGDQKNIVQLIVPGKKEGYAILDATQSEEHFVFPK